MNQITLKQQVPIMNVMIRNFQKQFFSWGIKKTGYDPDKNIRGSTAPLWINPSPGFYKTFFVLCLVSCFLLIGNISFVQIYTAINNAVNAAESMMDKSNSTNGTNTTTPASSTISALRQMNTTTLINTTNTTTSATNTTNTTSSTTSSSNNTTSTNATNATSSSSTNNTNSTTGSTSNTTLTNGTNTTASATTSNSTSAANSTSSNNSTTSATNSTSSTNSTTSVTNSTSSNNSTTSATNSTSTTTSSTTSSSTGTSTPLTQTTGNITNNDTICLKEIQESIDPIMTILGVIILFVNSLYAYFLLNIEYASDEEWTRYTLIKIGFWIALTVYIVIVSLNSQSMYLYYQKGIIPPTGVFTMVGIKTCKTIFLLNLVSAMLVAGICLTLSVFLFIKSVDNLRKMFFPMEGEDLIARSEDPDLIIL